MAAKPNKKKQKPPTRAIPHNSTIRKFRIVEFSLNIAAGWMVKVYPLRETSSETCFSRRNSHVPSARWTMLPDPFVRRLPLAAMIFLPVGSAFGHLPQAPSQGHSIRATNGQIRGKNGHSPVIEKRRNPHVSGDRKRWDSAVSQGCNPLLAHVELELFVIIIFHIDFPIISMIC